MGVFQDLRFALRVLVRKPLFTAVVVFTLALGIGAGSAMFSIVHALLAPPDRLARPRSPRGDPGERQGRRVRQLGVAADVPRLPDRDPLLRAAGRLSIVERPRSPARGDPEQVRAFQVSPGYFDLLGVRPLLGRWFAEDEVDGKQEKVVILSHALWDRRYGRDPAILGKSVVVAEESYVVVGVMPHDFISPSGPSCGPRSPSCPASARIAARATSASSAASAAGVALDDANAEMRLVGERHAAAYREDGKRAVRAVSLVRGVTDDFTRNFVTVLLGAALLVLLIACANVANLFLAHALARAQGAGGARGARRRPAAHRAPAAHRGRPARRGRRRRRGAARRLGGRSSSRARMPHATVQHIPGWASMGVEPAVLRLRARLRPRRRSDLRGVSRAPGLAHRREQHPQGRRSRRDRRRRDPPPAQRAGRGADHHRPGAPPRRRRAGEGLRAHGGAAARLRSRRRAVVQGRPAAGPRGPPAGGHRRLRARRARRAARSARRGVGGRGQQRSLRQGQRWARHLPRGAGGPARGRDRRRLPSRHARLPRAPPRAAPRGTRPRGTRRRRRAAGGRGERDRRPPPVARREPGGQTLPLRARRGPPVGHGGRRRRRRRRSPLRAGAARGGLGPVRAAGPGDDVLRAAHPRRPAGDGARRRAGDLRGRCRPAGHRRPHSGRGAGRAAGRRCASAS